MDIKELIDPVFDLLKAEAKKKLLSQVLKQAAWLGTWPMSILTNFILDKVLNFLVEKTDLLIDFLLIDHEVNSELKEVNEILAKIKDMRSKPDVTYEERAQINNDLARAGRELISLRKRS